MRRGENRADELRFDDAFLRKLERLALVAKRVVARGRRGERRTRRPGAGMDFADHRAYVAGDDLRHLDWNLYGRMERPLVRVFDEEEDLPIYTIIDASGSMAVGQPPKLRMAAEIAAALAYVSLANLDRVAVQAVAEGIGPGVGPVRGKGQISAVLALFEQVAAAGKTDLLAGVAALVERHRRRGLAVVISDFHDVEGGIAALDRLRHARCEPIAVHVTALEDADPPFRGDVTLIDAETGEERLVSVTASTLAAYRAAHRSGRERLAAHCREHRVPYFHVDSSGSFETLVLQVFRTGGILA